MDIEQIRAYCLSKPHATEDFPFDETTLVFRVMNKIFASIGLDNVDWFCLKCDPEYAIELREHYTGITGAWHWNKKYWCVTSCNKKVNGAVVKNLHNLLTHSRS